MKKSIALLLLALVGTLGCVAFPAKRTPKLDKPRVAPELREAPAIRLVVNDLSSEPKRAARSLEKARKRFPYLTTATEHTLDPDYTVELSVQDRLIPSGINDIAFSMLLIVPAIATAEVTVQATVTGADGQLLGTVESTGKCKRVAQMHLLWALPVGVPLWSHVNKKMWTNSFRDALIQASELIAEDQEHAANAGVVTVARVPSS
jgi:hypothetical protein